MAEYINRADIYKLFDGTNGIKRLHVADIDQLPTADVAVVKHGRWILREDGYHCSNCDIQAIYTGVKLNYCPNCGAKMEVDNG